MHFTRLLGLILVFVLIAAACGGDDDGGPGAAVATTDDGSDDGGSDDAGSDESGSSDDSGADENGGSDDSGADESGGSDDSAADAQSGLDDDDDSDDPVLSGDSGSDWCDGVRDAVENEADSPLRFGFIGLTPAQLEEQFKQNLDVLEMWASQAPPEIDDDVALLVDAFQAFVDFGSASGWDFNVMANDPDFGNAFDDADIDAASTRIDAYTTDVCGIDIGVDTGGGAAPGPEVPGDANLATQLLIALGVGANFLPADALECVSEGLVASGVFPDEIPPGYVPTEEAFDAIDSAFEDCGVDF